MNDKLADKRRRALRQWFASRRDKQSAICKRADVSESAVRKFLEDKNPSDSLQMSTYDKLALSEGVPVTDLLGEDAVIATRGMGMSLAKKRGHFEGMIDGGHRLFGFEVKAGMGPGQLPVDGQHAVESWEAPRGFFGRSPDLIVLEVKGDSMEPVLKSGDRVVIDKGDGSPSPGGIFCIFDGHGFMVKYVETIAQSKPMKIRILSNNSTFLPQEMEVNDDTIVGRVLGYVRRF